MGGLKLTSFIPDISIAPLQVHYYSEVLPTTALILCQSKYAEALQATVSEGLAQGPYVAVRVGFEPVTLRTQGTKLITEPPHATIVVKHKPIAMLICFSNKTCDKIGR